MREPALIIDGEVLVYGDNSEVVQAFNQIHDAIAGGATWIFTVKEVDGDYLIKREFLITPHTRVVANYSFNPADPDYGIERGS